MTQQLHEGQDVEVCDVDRSMRLSEQWRKAKIVYSPSIFPPRYEVQFPDGSRAVFDAEHIRSAISRPSGGVGDRFPSDFECANGDCE